MEKYKVGILGNGFVGQAIGNAFALTNSVFIYDKDETRRANTLRETIDNSDIVFVCVPTPMKVSKNNKIDLSIVQSLFEDIKNLNTDLKNKIFVIKSTVTPGTTMSLESKYKKMSICFNPEFLTERSANLDFINAPRIVIGSSNIDTLTRLESFYKQRFPYKNIIKTDSTTSEFIKYVCNCFFATKVTFMNEMYEMSTKLGLDWDKIREGLITDGRVGNSHLDVPGHDGDPGFGGKCFPKDINAIINYYEECNLDPILLKAVWEKNVKIRNKKDWESIEGATS